MTPHPTPTQVPPQATPPLNVIGASSFLRAVGNINRLIVLTALSDAEEMSVSQLLQHLNLSQSALSQHLALLRGHGLVACRRDGQTIYYRISDMRVSELLSALRAMQGAGQLSKENGNG
ncbi:transcriptional regulator [Kerstersia gyiorum]|uniref:ArsR/SmtB family transcription factor n=1 Tax=Kerstersia gyiorum TaxID=206506 RepID=UPI0010713B70|nr:transcriptional regulator [Kerstersia gyiorum]